MKKFILFLVLSPLALSAQNVLLSEDFNSGFPAWQLFDQDGNVPNSAVGFVNNAWVITEDSDSTGTGDSCAVSNSWYTPAGQADDWMVLPPVNLGVGGNYIYWQAKSEDGVFPEDYEIRISLTGSTPADFDTAYYTVTSEDQYWNLRSISLDAFANQTIYIAFVNKSDDNFLLMVDNIRVVELDPVGIEEHVVELQVYPNPTSDFIFIEDTDIENFILVSVSGQEFALEAENGKLDLTGFADGMYFIRGFNNGYSFQSTIVIAH